MTLNAKVKRLAGLVGTRDITQWEDDFLTSVLERTNDGENTSSLTERQIEVIERLFSKHYGDSDRG